MTWSDGFFGSHRFGDGNRQPGERPAARASTFEADPAAHQFHEPPGDRESQSRAAKPSRLDLVQLNKFLEGRGALHRKRVRLPKRA